ncbi:MAG: SH3-domain kinase binding protein 1, partial [Paramarteilia canceri]
KIDFSEVIETVVCNIEYKKDQDDEISIYVGDIILVLEKDIDEGWDKGRNMTTNMEGVFPVGYVIQ